jgi:HD-like signal output (HDOD) protein
MELTALLEQPFDLPCIPRVVAILLFELERPEADLKRISQLLSGDLGLTARLLQTANDTYFGLSGQIRSVPESLALLGLGHARSMVAAALPKASLKSVPGVNLQQFWNYSLNVGKVARSLAGVLHINQQAAFTSGLLHAMGELAMMQVMPETMAKINPDVPPLSLKRSDLEIKLLGYDFGLVSAALARRWHYPQAMVDALEHQADPFENDNYEPLAGVLHLAGWRARAKEARLDERGLAVTFPGAVGDILKLDIDMVLQQDPIDWTSPVQGKSLT